MYWVDWSLVTFVAKTSHHGRQGLWSLSAQAFHQTWRVTECIVGTTAFFPQLSPDTNVCSDHDVPQDMLTGKIWLSISQLNWECTCHSLLDKLWLAPVHQASELWKPLMDEIWTSIFLSSCLLNKLLLKFTAMFADMCFRKCSCLRAFPSAQDIFRAEGNNLCEKQSEFRWEREDIFWRASGLMRGLSCWVHEAWR